MPRLFIAILSPRLSRLGGMLEEIVSFLGKVTTLKIDTETPAILSPRVLVLGRD